MTKNTHIKWPKISIVMCSLNDEKGVQKALQSVRNQSYPKNKVEIIVVDNGSTDKSAAVARKFTRKVVVSYKHGYETRADGMRMATGEFVYMIIEQDMEFRGRDFLKRMVRPMIENKEIAASFTREYPRKDQPWVTRFISYHPIQCDPIFEYLTPSIESTIVTEKSQYSICKFIPGKIPPVTHMLFRVDYLKKTAAWNQKKDFDHDTVMKVIKGGYDLFAYVPKAGDYHHHAKNLKHLLSKRVRNLNAHYFPYNKTSGYKWVNTNSSKDTLRLALWVVYANLFIPALVRGILRFMKYKDWALLMEPVITITTTDLILWQFLTNNVGRSILKQSVASIFVRS